MIVFEPEISVPDSENPIVLSTVITEDPIETLSETIELGVILKVA